MNRMRRLIIIIVAVVALGAVAFVAYRYQIFSLPVEQLSRADFAERELSILRDTLAGVSSSEEEGRVRRTIASVTMRISAAEGFQMLRDIAADSSLPASERALAVQMMGDTYTVRSSQSLDFARQYVFVGEPYASMLNSRTESASLRVWDAVKELYEYSLLFSDAPIAHYRIAMWHLSRAGETALALGELVDGNKTYDAFLASLPEEDQVMAYHATRLRAAVTGRIGLRNNDAVLLGEARRLYAQTRADLQSELQIVSDAAFTVELLWTDLYYAQFLASQNDVANDALIEELLIEIAQLNDEKFGFSRYIARVGTISGHAEQKSLLSLATRNAQFYEMLKGLGWEL